MQNAAAGYPNIQAIDEAAIIVQTSGDYAWTSIEVQRSDPVSLTRC